MALALGTLVTPQVGVNAGFNPGLSQSPPIFGAVVSNNGADNNVLWENGTLALAIPDAGLVVITVASATGLALVAGSAFVSVGTGGAGRRLQGPVVRTFAVAAVDQVVVRVNDNLFSTLARTDVTVSPNR